jgi:hypothetical protein
MDPVGVRAIDSKDIYLGFGVHLVVASLCILWHSRVAALEHPATSARVLHLDLAQLQIRSNGDEVEGQAIAERYSNLDPLSKQIGNYLGFAYAPIVFAVHWSSYSSLKVPCWSPIWVILASFWPSRSSSRITLWRVRL